MGEGAAEYYVLAGIRFSQQKNLRARTAETAHNFMEKEMDLTCAFRLCAPFLGQQRIHAEGTETLPLPLGEEFRPARDRRREYLRTLLFALGLRWLGGPLRPGLLAG